MTFKFAGALLRLIGYRRLIQVEAATVHEGVQALLKEFPGLEPILYDEKRQIRSSHRFLLNGKPITQADFERALEPTDCVQVVTAIAGG